MSGKTDSRLKELLGLDEITMRGIAKVTVKAALILVVMLGTAVGAVRPMAQRHRLEELRTIVTAPPCLAPPGAKSGKTNWGHRQAKG